MKIATEIKAGDIIRTFSGYYPVIEVQNVSRLKIAFKYMSADGIINWITYKKTTNVKTKP